MIIVLVFIFLVLGLASWWLLSQGVTAKPWLASGTIAESGLSRAYSIERIGLGIFLVVVGSLFALFGSAFVMRMDLEVGTALTLPGLVWFNTLLLVFASVCFHLGKRSALGGDLTGTKLAMAVGGLSTLGFLSGQLLVWRTLQGTGDGLTSGPGASFFYLLSGLHGVHILGGIVAVATMLTGAGANLTRTQARVGLCATYWDFLLIIWLGLLFLFRGWANEFLDICRSILT